MWNHDISAAPRGKMVRTTVKTKDGLKQAEAYQREYIIAAGRCGAVTKSYWIPDQERWCMFTKDVPPGAWMPWPENPFSQNTDAAISRPGIATLGRPEDENRSAEEAPEADVSGGVQDRVRVHPATHFILEDVGGGA